MVADRNRRYRDIGHPFVTPTKPTYASLPVPGIQPVLMDDLRNEIEQIRNQVTFALRTRGPVWLEPYGAITSDLLIPTSRSSRASISPGTVPA